VSSRSKAKFPRKKRSRSVEDEEYRIRPSILIPKLPLLKKKRKEEKGRKHQKKKGKENLPPLSPSLKATNVRKKKGRGGGRKTTLPTFSPLTIITGRGLSKRRGRKIDISIISSSALIGRRKRKRGEVKKGGKEEGAGALSFIYTSYLSYKGGKKRRSKAAH